MVVKLAMCLAVNSDLLHWFVYFIVNAREAEVMKIVPLADKEVLITKLAKRHHAEWRRLQ